MATTIVEGPRRSPRKSRGNAGKRYGAAVHMLCKHVWRPSPPLVTGRLIDTARGGI